MRRSRGEDGRSGSGRDEEELVGEMLAGAVDRGGRGWQGAADGRERGVAGARCWGAGATGSGAEVAGDRWGAGGCGLGEKVAVVRCRVREGRRQKMERKKEKGERRGRGRGSRDLDEKSRDLFVGWRDWNRKKKEKEEGGCKVQGGRRKSASARIRVLEARWAWAGLGYSLAILKNFYFAN